MNVNNDNMSPLATIPDITMVIPEIHSINNLYNVASLPLLGTPLVGSINVIIPVVLVISLIKVTVLTFEVVHYNTL